MKEVLPTPAPAIVQNETKRVRELFERNVVPSYARFDLVLERGEGSYVWDVDGKRYLDLAAGIAVCSLGHAHPEITNALADQSQKLIHVSNLYYNELQGRLAKRIVDLIAPGRVFFSPPMRMPSASMRRVMPPMATTGRTPPLRCSPRPSSTATRASTRGSASRRTSLRAMLRRRIPIKPSTGRFSNPSPARRVSGMKTILPIRRPGTSPCSASSEAIPWPAFPMWAPWATSSSATWNPTRATRRYA